MVKVDKELLKHIETYSIAELEDFYGVHRGYIEDGRSIITIVRWIVEDVCSEVEEDESSNR